MKFVVLAFAGLMVVVAAAEKQPYERYQPIVDRQMFGPLPPGFDPTKMPSEAQKSAPSARELSQEQEKLQSAIHFSVINVTPDGATAVGFTDNTDPKAPVHYYLKVGEKRNGWEVKTADAAAATMTVAKGDIEVSLSLGGNSAKDAAATAKAASGGRPGGGRPGLLGGSLRSRRLMRERLAQEEREKAEAAAAAAEAERRAQAEADKEQREAERAEQRQQLLAIQEELKRVREAKAAEKAQEKSDEGANE